MKKTKIIAIIVVLILIIALTLACIFILNKDKYILCEASEVNEGITTKVISKYNYDQKGLVINSIDYTIELSGTMDDKQIAASKMMFENTICGTTKPDNVTCTIETAKNKVKVITHEEIKDNKSTLLGLEDLDKLTYEVNKENNKDNKECKFN